VTGHIRAGSYEVTMLRSYEQLQDTTPEADRRIACKAPLGPLANGSGRFEGTARNHS
jgi:hypothetical protein